ncbi:hypothetical protein D3C77_500350 [compost metagenome]
MGRRDHRAVNPQLRPLGAPNGQGVRTHQRLVELFQQEGQQVGVAVAELLRRLQGTAIAVAFRVEGDPGGTHFAVQQNQVGQRFRGVVERVIAGITGGGFVDVALRHHIIQAVVSGRGFFFGRAELDFFGGAFATDFGVDVSQALGLVILRPLEQLAVDGRTRHHLIGDQLVVAVGDHNARADRIYRKRCRHVVFAPSSGLAGVYGA